MRTITRSLRLCARQGLNYGCSSRGCRATGGNMDISTGKPLRLSP